MLVSNGAGYKISASGLCGFVRNGLGGFAEFAEGAKEHRGGGIGEFDHEDVARADGVFGFEDVGRLGRPVEKMPGSVEFAFSDFAGEIGDDGGGGLLRKFAALEKIERGEAFARIDCGGKTTAAGRIETVTIERD